MQGISFKISDLWKNSLHAMTGQIFWKRFIKKLLKRFLLYFSFELHVIRKSLACHSYVTRMYSYVIRMPLVCTRMSSVYHPYVPVCHPHVTCMYSYVMPMSLVCTRMSCVCHSYVPICHPYVTRMYSYVMRMSLLCTRMSFLCDLYVVLPWISKIIEF